MSEIGQVLCVLQKLLQASSRFVRNKYFFFRNSFKITNVNTLEYFIKLFKKSSFFEHHPL